MVDDDQNLSPDEALEATNAPDYDTDVGYKDILPEDNDRPFKPADNPSVGSTPIDHPNTDSDVDLHEQYDVGPAEASGQTTQSGNTVNDDSEQAA